jgi:hypothetical protein
MFKVLYTLGGLKARGVWPFGYSVILVYRHFGYMVVCVTWLFWMFWVYF